MHRIAVLISVEGSRITRNLLLILIAVYTHAEPITQIVKGYASRSGRLDIAIRCLINVARFGKNFALPAKFAIVFDRFNKVLEIDVQSIPRELFTELQFLDFVARCLRNEIQDACHVDELSYVSYLEKLKRNGLRIVLMSERGSRRDRLPCRNVAYIVGSDVDAPTTGLEDDVISIGTQSYLASHVVAYVVWRCLDEYRGSG